MLAAWISHASQGDQPHFAPKVDFLEMKISLLNLDFSLRVIGYKVGLVTGRRGSNT